MSGHFVSQLPFHILGLARLGVKPRLCRSYQRAFAFTHPLMLPSTSPTKAFLACPLSPLWNCFPSLWGPPFPLHALALIPLFLAKVGLSFTFTLSPSIRSGAIIKRLCSFSFWRRRLGVLANYSLCGTEITLSFSAGPVCSSFSAEACAILHALCWSRQYQKVCHFSSLLLLPDSRSVLATLSSPPSFLLPRSFRQI